ncbi:MAG: hypothetical protein ACTSQO_08410 [Candidatus Helarchaeota archaeon]
MKCQLCGKKEAEFECIDCGRLICKDCAIFCEFKERGYCVQKLGDIVVYECKGIVCKKCADFTLVHRCYECNVQFCNAILDTLIYECDKCLNKICPDCKEYHIAHCDVVFDREKALDRLYKNIHKDNENK